MIALIRLRTVEDTRYCSFFEALLGGLAESVGAGAAIEGAALGGIEGAALGGVEAGALGGVEAGALGGIEAGALGGAEAGALGGVEAGALGGVEAGALGGAEAGALGGEAAALGTAEASAAAEAGALGGVEAGAIGGAEAVGPLGATELGVEASAAPVTGVGSALTAAPVGSIAGAADVLSGNVGALGALEGGGEGFGFGGVGDLSLGGDLGTPGVFDTAGVNFPSQGVPFGDVSSEVTSLLNAAPEDVGVFGQTAQLPGTIGFEQPITTPFDTAFNAGGFTPPPSLSATDIVQGDFGNLVPTGDIATPVQTISVPPDTGVDVVPGVSPTEPLPPPSETANQLADVMTGPGAPPANTGVVAPSADVAPGVPPAAAPPADIAPAAGPPAPAAPSAAGTGSISSQLAGVLNSPFTRAAELGVPLAALGATVLRGQPNLPSTATSAVANANTLSSFGTQQLNQASNFQLNPSQLAILQQNKQNQLNQLYQLYASMGRDPNKDSDYLLGVQQIEANSLAQMQQFIQQMITNGLTATGQADQTLLGAAQIQVANDNAFMQSIGSALTSFGLLAGLSNAGQKMAA